MADVRDASASVPAVRWSVIVPARDVRAHLPAFLAGLRALRVPSGGVEVLVVDNGSTDGSAERLAAEPGISLLHEATVGAYAARNAGVRAARGALLAFTDPDCVVAPDWLEQYEQAFRDPRVVLACGPRHPARWTRGTKVLADYETAKDAAVLGGDDASRYYGFTNNLALRREVLEGPEPFVPVPRGADAILVRRVVDRFGTSAVAFASRAVVLHAEFTGVLAYYRKVLTYARTRRAMSQVAGAYRTRALSLRERAGILRDCAGSGRLGPLDLVVLVLLLAVGLAVWEVGARVPWPARPRTV